MWFSKLLSNKLQKECQLMILLTFSTGSVSCLTEKYSKQTKSCPYRPANNTQFVMLDLSCLPGWENNMKLLKCNHLLYIFLGVNFRLNYLRSIHNQ